MIRTVPNAVSLFLSLILPAAAAQQAGPPLSPDAEIVLREYLVIEPCGRGGRNPVHTDAVEAAIVAGTFEAPREGLKVALPGGGEKEWKSAAANDKGELQHAALRGGYAFTTVTLAAAGTMLLDASGHSMVYVNGEPRAGDVYSNGSVILPLALREGENTFLFAGGRGRVAARLKPTDGKPFFTDRDWTLPDVVVGESEPLWVGVVIANPANAALSNATIVATTLGGKSLSGALPSVPALSTRKCPIRFEAPGIIEGSEVPVKLELSVGGALVAEKTIQIAPRLATEQHKRTFVSDIDGSVQYYAVTPPREAVESPALFLSVHGASVEATNQAASYAPKNWGVVVAPTNRRPFGFDWEDWGRLDALEVLNHAEERYHTDPRRTYLTGHSMGGHGSWQLSVHYPDRFAAVGPSAGWISFFSYGGTDRTASSDRRVQMLQRAANSSDTLALIENLRTMGVYILHGDADDNVPVSEAREMRRRLGDFHRDYDWHEQPGAGHWWESSDEPGAECVDWPPMFDFFARHRRPAASEVRDVDFRTVAPSISDRCDWAAIV
ncbi:MAG: prolyl oligopeptidase family serine peptidase, partial [Phycisphaerales bacterium]|nr:prolyl oligopeptidase family serine peptidase [Phycisphaerales bacterium]